MPLPASFGVASAIAFCALVITQQRCSPSTPVASTFALRLLNSLKVGSSLTSTGLLASATNGPTNVVAPDTFVVLNMILLSSIVTESGISFLTIISTTPSVWLIACLVTGIAIPIRCGVAVSLDISISVSVRATPSPCIVASTVS